MIKIICFLVFGFGANLCSAQTTFLNFGDSQTIVVNDVEFGYSIEKEQPLQFNGAEYIVLTINWYLTNKDRFSKIFVVSQFSSGDDEDIDLTKKICLAKLHIRNAVGNSFSLIVEKPNIFLKVNKASGWIKPPLIFQKKDEIPAFYLRSGTTIKNTIEVKLPKERKPDIALQAFVSQVY
ncbi:MAG: hypothetical protein QM668_07750 [Agriterribacter sp.]